jgi:hypothetical protein
VGRGRSSTCRRCPAPGAELSLLFQRRQERDVLIFDSVTGHHFLRTEESNSSRDDRACVYWLAGLCVTRHRGQATSTVDMHCLLPCRLKPEKKVLQGWVLWSCSPWLVGGIFSLCPHVVLPTHTHCVSIPPPPHLVVWIRTHPPDPFNLIASLKSLSVNTATFRGTGGEGVSIRI